MFFPLFDRNSIVGIDLLVVGSVVSSLGYVVAQSVPIASFGFAVLIIGALILLILPEPIPKDAFAALLKDAISNVEILLEESGLRNRAYFVRIEDEVARDQKQIRAFVPFVSDEADEMTPKPELLQMAKKIPRRLVTNYGDLRGLLLIPPGNEIVRLARIEKGDDLEESLSSALVDFSDLCSSVLAIEDQGAQTGVTASEETVRIQIKGPKISSDSPYFKDCLGSPTSCIAACVVTVVKGSPVKFVDEKYDEGLVRLTLAVLSSSTSRSEMEKMEESSRGL